MTNEEKKTLRLARNLYKIMLDRDGMLETRNFISARDINIYRSEICHFLDEYHDYMIYKLTDLMSYKWAEEFGVRVLEERYCY